MPGSLELEDVIKEFLKISKIKMPAAIKELDELMGCEVLALDDEPLGESFAEYLNSKWVDPEEKLELLVVASNFTKGASECPELQNPEVQRVARDYLSLCKERWCDIYKTTQNHSRDFVRFVKNSEELNLKTLKDSYANSAIIPQNISQLQQNSYQQRIT